MPDIKCRIIEVCVFRRVDGRVEYLMLRRSPDERVYPNLWQFVSGAIDDGERAVDAALRELKEETGFVPRRFWNVPYVNMFYDHTNDSVNLSPLFASEVARDETPVLSSEHGAYEWLRFPDALRRLVWPGQRAGLEIVDQYIIGGEEAGVLTEIPL